MNSNPPQNTEKQRSTNTNPYTAVIQEADEIDFATALDMLRDGIDHYGEQLHASTTVARTVEDLGIDNELLIHPKIQKSIWEYEHNTERVRSEIKRTIDHVENDNEEVNSSDIIAAYRVAAARLDTPISTN